MIYICVTLLLNPDESLLFQNMCRAQGLMFHEYHYIPKSFKELWESIQASDSKLRMPPRLKRQ
jgi:hypothetical protein